MLSARWKKIYKWVQYVLIGAGMKFRNKKKFRYGIPPYTGPFQVLVYCMTYNLLKTRFLPIFNV
jgi:hypothetical protein